MTSMKTELIAIIIALFVCKEESHVTIYTDSKSFLKKYNSLTKDNNRFRYPRANLKDTYTKYWQLLFHLIDSLQLKVTFKKVKAHNNNKHNNDADYLAKEATDLEEELNIDTCVFSQININYKHQEIERDLRGFIKEICHVNRFTQFLSLNRNRKYLKTNIDWSNTCTIIYGSESSNVTSFASSFHRSKRVKILLEELPTIEFYKAVKPDVYDSTWNCLYCNTNESFHHLWTCPGRLSDINEIITLVKNTLGFTIKKAYGDLKEPQQVALNDILSHGT